ncbi:MAG: ABC transporter permease [Microbacterium sp.]
MVTNLAAGPARVGEGTARTLRLSSWGWGVVGGLIVFAVWIVVALIVPGGAVPPPWTVVATAIDDGWDFYSTAVGATLTRVFPGYLWGNAFALGLVALVFLVPALEETASQLALISHCIPVTAIGPIIMIIFGGRAAAVFLAALSVFFISFVTALLGIHAAQQTALDLVSAYGGGRVMRLRKVQLVAALPTIFLALQIAMPVAFIGAILGEYLGGIDTGIGVVLQSAQRDFMPARTWGVALVIGIVSLALYGLVGLLGRLLLPWARSGLGGRS